MTLDQLQSIFSKCKRIRLALLKPYLEEAMVEWEINTAARKAAFLAQIAHESCDLNFFEEIASGAAYEDRSDLGNNRPGDGPRFKGRGPLQITGRENYRKAGRALKLPLEEQPGRAASADVAFRIAGWFWSTHGCNALADAGDFDAISVRINGGYVDSTGKRVANGKAQRDVYHMKALAAFADEEAVCSPHPDS
jgi:putative chitinase